MPDYKTMYTKLFNIITDVIEQLQKAQRETENLYIESTGHEIALVGIRDAQPDSYEGEQKENYPQSEHGNSHIE